MDNKPAGLDATQVRHFMIDHELKPKDLAKEVGIHLYSLYRLLNGETQPTMQNLIGMCRALECTPNDIIYPIVAPIE